MTFLGKMSLWASWAAAGAIFLTVGWTAMAPEDPLGAMSLLLRHGGLLMWLQAAGLAVLTSAIGTLLVGRVAPFGGPFAAALGLTLVSFRASTAESLLLAASSSGMTLGALALRMLMEAFCWMALMLVAFVASAWISRRLLPRSEPATNDRTENFFDSRGLAFSAIAALFSLVIFSVLDVSMQTREIRHTQVCFVVGASVWLGCYIAHRFLPTLGIRFYVLGAWLMVTCGYVWSLRSAWISLPPAVPPSNFLRLLPIQFVAVGVMAAIAVHGSHMRHSQIEGAGPERPDKPRSEGGPRR